MSLFKNSTNFIKRILSTGDLSNTQENFYWMFMTPCIWSKISKFKQSIFILNVQNSSLFIKKRQRSMSIKISISRSTRILFLSQKKTMMKNTINLKSTIWSTKSFKTILIISKRRIWTKIINVIDVTNATMTDYCD